MRAECKSNRGNTLPDGMSKWGEGSTTEAGSGTLSGLSEQCHLFLPSHRLSDVAALCPFPYVLSWGKKKQRRNAIGS